MKLIYNLKNRLYVIQNFLPFNFYKELHKIILKQKNYQSSLGNWEKSLHDNLKPVDTFAVPNDFLSKIEILYRHQPFVKIEKDHKLHFTFHKMRYGSGINWHDDTDHDWAFTFYLNKRWNHQWGGEFMFDFEGNKGFVPIFANTLVILKEHTSHKVNNVLSKYFPRFSLQCFIDNPTQVKKNNDKNFKSKNSLASK
jgi:Rps23 Pro-64 3,4-dihydroxylase Tpa1-like proline 4-hydroxylase